VHGGFLVRKPEGKEPLGRHRPVGKMKIILKWVFKTWDEAWIGLIWLKIGTGGELCECGNEPSCSTIFWEFLG
jgi:hypothetical protein